MIKYEYGMAVYKSEAINYESFVAWLNEQGKDGWGMVHMQVVPPAEVVCIFKRRKGK